MITHTTNNIRSVLNMVKQTYYDLDNEINGKTDPTHIDPERLRRLKNRLGNQIEELQQEFKKADTDLEPYVRAMNVQRTFGEATSSIRNVILTLMALSALAAWLLPSILESFHAH